MRADQIARLEALRDRLVEVALSDADPDHWIGAGLNPGEMTREERGDAKWCRSLAVSTVALTMQVQRMMADAAPKKAAAAAAAETDEEEAVEADIAHYEKAAAAVLDRHRRGRAKR